MEHFVATAFAFPTLIFTLGVLFSLCYWALVMFGALDLDFADGAELGEVGEVGDFGGDVELGEAGDVDLGDGDGADGDADSDSAAEAASSSASILSLRRAPLTIGLSLLSFFGWAISYGLSGYAGVVPGPPLVGDAVVALLSFVIAWPMASMASAPIGRLLAPDVAPSKSVLVGKVARIKVHADAGGRGQATLDDGSGSLLRVRCADAPLSKNAKVLLLDYDVEADLYEVELMDSLLEGED